MKNIESHYIWKEKLISDQEIMILIKTNHINEENIIKEIKLLHSYENPEIVSYEFDILSKEYKKWFDKIVDK